MKRTDGVRSVAAVRLVALMAALVLLALPAACGADDGESTVDTAGQTTASGETTTSRQTTSSGPETCTTSSSSSSTTAATTTTTAAAPTTTAATTTTALSTTTTTTDPVDQQLKDRQTRLDELGYWLGEVDGQMGSMTRHAVTAFQKAEGLDRTGTFNDATVERLATATRLQPRSGSGDVLEVDRARQILLVAGDGQVRWVFDIATGTSATPTPAGEFSIYREIDGIREAPLGTLYRPKYFNGGIALHGYTSVPSQPASHGCVRLTYPAMDFVWGAGLAPIGIAVSVY